MRDLHKYRSMLFAALVSGASMGAPAPDARAASPFPQLAGNWSGGGQIRFQDGKSERISCKAYYNSKSAGLDLALAIRCASSSYKIEMRANLNHQGGRVTGNWEERTFNAEGTISGRATDSNLSLAINGGGVSGTMAVTISDLGHRVDITTAGIGLSGVSINLSRG